VFKFVQVRSAKFEVRGSRFEGFGLRGSGFNVAALFERRTKNENPELNLNSNREM